MRTNHPMALAVLVLFTACQADSGVITDEPTQNSITASSVAAAPDRYIVTLRPGVADVPGLARSIVNSHRGVLHHTYVQAIQGFAAELPSVEVAAVRRHPDVVAIERDAIITISTTQTSAPWGLDRIDQATLPLSGTYTYGPTGSGVRVYIIDTGIRTSHVDFGGRASGGFTAITDGNGTADCNGHGTHVAGTVGGATWGVAKQASLVAVRVLGCDGTGYTSGVIAGVDWVTANSVRPAVANMSLGGGVSSALDQAVQRSIDAGITYAVAAGNDNVDACTGSPARISAALTAGASTSSDARASFSNFGTCVDLFGPGLGIVSAYATADNATATLSGTSMASPHVAGVAALYLQGAPTASPSAVSLAITGNAGSGLVSSIGSGSPNRLLNVGFLTGTTPPPPPPVTNPPPVARFTWSCPTTTCQLDASSSSDNGTIVSYSWNLGRYPNPTATGVTVQATYPHVGPRTVTLTVTDNGGLSASVTTVINVGATPPPPVVDNAPVASFTRSCTYLSCSFNASGSTDDNQIQQYSWSFAQGTPGTATGVLASTAYATAGTRTVTLTVTDNAGQSASTSQTFAVSAPPVVDNPPVARFTWSCPTTTCQLDASTSSDDGTIVSYSWDLGRSPNPTATGVSVRPTYPHPGLRTVTLTVTDNSGQTASVTQVITIP